MCVCLAVDCIVGYNCCKGATIFFSFSFFNIGWHCVLNIWSYAHIVYHCSPIREMVCPIHWLIILICYWMIVYVFVCFIFVSFSSSKIVFVEWYILMYDIGCVAIGDTPAHSADGIIWLLRHNWSVNNCAIACHIFLVAIIVLDGIVANSLDSAYTFVCLYATGKLLV